MTNCKCKSESDKRVCGLIQKWIKKSRKEIGIKISPYEINNGWCEEIGLYVEENLKGADAVWMEELIDYPEFNDYAHMVIRYKKKWYDAEVPCGVKDIHELPIVIHMNDIEYHKKMKKVM